MVAWMLHAFLTAHRSALIERCGQMTAERTEDPAPDPALLHGIPIFLDQLIKTLSIEQTAERPLSMAVSGQPGTGGPSEIGSTAVLHGHELFKRGFTLEQAVRDYGDLCQAITSLADDLGTKIEVDEFRTFNRCLDNAIAEAVTEFANEQRTTAAEDCAVALNTRMGCLAHELRNLVLTATLAVKALKSGNVGLSGATGAVLDRSLRSLSSLIDRSLAEVRAAAGLPAQQKGISLADFISEVALAARFDADARKCTLAVEPVDPGLVVNVDRDMLTSAVGNLLQNAFKFTQPHTQVTLDAYATADRIRIDVHDHCGGLPIGAVENMFRPFSQSGEDRSGLGLGLDICRRSVEANAGNLSVKDHPGSGCVFTIDLPLHKPVARETSDSTDA
jgi:signal transduction histidine kinase